MTREELLRIMPLAGSRVDRWLSPLNAAMASFGIDTPARRAAFLAQIAHESDNLKSVVENLNYSPEALMATFNTDRITRFTKVDAYRFGRTPEHPADQRAIANLAYAGRMGNGPMESGDGWNYRGRGPGQLTGKSNYAKCGATIGLDLLTHPELVEMPEVGTEAFAWFWTEGNPKGIDLSLLADAGNIDGISRAINGGDNGLNERRNLYVRAIGVLV